MKTSWASVPRTRAPRADLPPPSTTPAGVRSAALAVSGALLLSSAATCAVPLFSSAPVQAQEPVPTTTTTSSVPAPSQGRSVVFDYSAAVAPNDVYDTRRAQAPLPLFRALGDVVDVVADYTGPAARLGLLARLSSTTGWTTSVPLADEVAVDERGRVRASLDLRRLEQRAALVATQTRMPFSDLTVELVAVVRDDAGTWAPAVALQLTPQQLRLTGEPSTLVVREGSVSGGGVATPPAPTPQSRLDDLLGWRPGGVLTTLVLTLAVAGGSVVVRRRQDEDDAERARRRLGRLLLGARPMDLSALRVVDVDTPDALARLAERYGLLVLHWTDAAGAVFVVHDDATAYRWATGERPAGPGPVPTGERDEQDDDARRREAERLEAERLEAERLEAQRLEAERLEAERRSYAEAAERARREADLAQAARVEAERLERQRAAEADRAAQAWAAFERSCTPAVPAPRTGVAEEQLADGPPREALLG